ncbi:hypothetical protein PsorP6_004046 [Peronosclerospora sorghi]|uniref:Uncharacterized protein n=1 Tax=Peronosclerospora sorghi TaxID=230839 RepID=A0ACC0VNG0_9STRA|nr:hypothetical protein PsorP6_004046 [Peronosclerospora sorghi]
MIGDQGTEVTEHSEASQLLLQQFVDYVKLHKVVLLHLASEFQMDTKGEERDISVEGHIYD